MDIYSQRSQALSGILGIRIDCDSAASSVPDGIARQVASGRLNGWSDAEGSVHLVSRNIRPDSVSVDAAAVYHAVCRHGMEGLLGPRRFEVFCLELGSSSGIRPDGLFGRAGSLKDIGRDRLATLPDSHTPEWDEVARCFCGCMGLPYSYQVASSLCAGHARHRRGVLLEAERSCDIDALQDHLSHVLSSGSRSDVVRFGTVSDVYRRVGYPPLPFHESVGHLRGFLDRNSLPLSVAEDLVRAVQDPVAILRGFRGEDGSEPERCVVLTDIQPVKGVFLAVVTDSPDRAAREAEENGPSLRCRGIILWDERTLISALSQHSRLQEGILYLKPKHGPDGTSYVMSDLLAKMKDGVRHMHRSRAVQEKKNAIGTLLYMTPDLSRRLMVSANIVNDFKNPMSSEKYRKVYGHERHERAESASVEPGRRQEPEVPRPSVVKTDGRSFRERLMTSLYDGPFSAATLKKLSGDGITNAGALITIGDEALERRYGRRALRDSIGFLESLGLSFSSGGKRRRHEHTDRPFGTLSEEEKRSEMYKELHKALSEVPDDLSGRSLKMPVDSSGIYYSGVAAMSLVARMSWMERWQGCNVFLSERELSGIGISPLSSAVPCAVSGMDGRVECVYNLRDTTLASSPHLLDEVCRAFRASSAEVPGYIRSLLPNVKVGTLEECRDLSQFLDGACRMRVRTADLEPKAPVLKDVLVDSTASHVMKHVAKEVKHKKI